MTKKQKKAENNTQRGTWFGVDPRSKVIPDKKKNANKTACRSKVNY